MSCKFKVGGKLKVKWPGNANHGRVFTICQEYNASPHGWYVENNTLLFYDSQITSVVSNRAGLQEEIDRVNKQMVDLSKEIDVYNQQLAYLDETNQEELEETEFKAYYALKVLEKENMSTVERAKAIANLVNMTK